MKPEQDEKQQEIQLPVSLRDYFAAKALNGIIGNTSSMNALHTLKDAHETIFSATAILAYTFADAMLKARVS